MTTTYEWDIETWRGEEIIDHNHRDRLAEFGMEELIQAINCDILNSQGDFTKLVLVRDSDRDGRAWAYITDDGKLPDEMVDALEKVICAVPKRYREEFAR